MGKPVCVVFGVGPGNGASFARRFSAEGHAVALLARGTEFTTSLAAELPDARAYACDAMDPARIDAVFGEIEAELGPVETLIYNAGSGIWGTVEEVSPEDFETAWRINCLGLYHAARRVIPGMKSAGKGNIIVIGATASLRGGARFAAFASAKAAQRNLTQSLARNLWPDGIHVALLIIDGVIDLPRTRQRLPDKPDEFFLDPDEIAAAVWNTARQHRSAWSFEVEVRPFQEKW